MRQTVYVKDEDYRLSFLHGNFVTLTNMKRWELERIAEQRLSPIYVSVHSTDPEIRIRLLRPRVDADVLEQIDFLSGNGIVMHTQVVLCPGYNDDDDLDRTISELSARWPLVRSLAVVPVGLTEHRSDLAELRPVTAEDARFLLDRLERYQMGFREELGVSFVYAGDELYHLVGILPPEEDHYDGFPQIENGVGITRQFLDRMECQDSALFGTHRAVTLATGEMFAPTLRAAMEDWRRRTGVDIRVDVVGCANRFFGRSVTVAGLLTASDIARALTGRDLGERVYIPSETLNEDALFLDDKTVGGLAEVLDVPVEAGFDWR
jgi:putative radical SAM enzyme (TIGR03279 family)